MLPTFVIGLREGLEAALIVGIIAAFLRKQGRRDLLGWVLLGVGVAVAVCALVGVALELYSKNLPQRQQEGLETIIGALAVAMVTYMVIWMRRNSRHLKGQLEGMAADAIAVGGTGRSKALRAMVLMAFLAVIREGFETAVFLLAAFNEPGSGVGAGSGAVLGIAVAVVLGYGIYRGGVRLNLSKFFRATGLVLVLVAAGLFVNTLHTAHEAGWLDIGQGRTVDLTWLVEPGTVQASLLTGMLGVQGHPVVIEVVGWLLYLVPIGCYVAWPPGRAVPARALARTTALSVAVLAAAAAVLALAAPDRPDAHPTTGSGVDATQVLRRSADAVTVRTAQRMPVAGTTGAPADLRLAAAGSARHLGLTTTVYRSTRVGAGDSSQPATLPAAEVARLNGGRLPIGVGSGDAFPVNYRDRLTLTVWLDTRTDRVVDLAWTERVDAIVRAGSAAYPLPDPVGQARAVLPAAVSQAAAAAVRDTHARLDHRRLLGQVALWMGILAGLGALAAAGFAVAGRRRDPEATPVTPRVGELVRN